MPAFRSFFLQRPWLIALVVLGALAVRVAIPAGFMPVADKRVFRVAMCSGSGNGPLPDLRLVVPIEIPQGEHPAQSDGGCAFADLSMSLLGGADPLQLAAAILYAIAAALFFCAAVPRIAAPRLRPPLRAPPILA